MSESAAEANERLRTAPLGELLTPFEWDFVRKQRIIECLSNLLHTVVYPAWTQSYLDLCGGDTAVMGMHYGRCRAFMAVALIFCAPIAAALSDTIGRRHMMTWGRLGWVAFFGFHRFRDRGIPGHVSGLRMRLLAEILCWGVVSAGVWPAFAAAHSDVFGERPQLSARIHARDGMWKDATSVLGVAMIPVMTHFFGLQSANWASVVLGLAGTGVCLTLPETLKEEKRKPFTVARANPFGNILLLMRNGPGLRRLSLSTVIFLAGNETWATQSSFRLGVLNWTPAFQSYFIAVSEGTRSLTQGSVLDGLFKRLGNKNVFQLGALTAVASYLLQSQSIRPGGASAVRKTIQYGVALLLLETIPVGMQHAMRAMVVKQGIAATTAGRGALNAACASSQPPDPSPGPLLSVVAVRQTRGSGSSRAWSSRWPSPRCSNSSRATRARGGCGGGRAATSS